MLLVKRGSDSPVTELMVRLQITHLLRVNTSPLDEGVVPR